MTGASGARGTDDGGCGSGERRGCGPGGGSGSGSRTTRGFAQGDGGGSESGDNSGDVGTGSGGDGDGEGDAEGDTLTDLAERRGLDDVVYAAAEDSRLLADAAVEAVEPSWRVLEVGTGSGYVAERVGSETGAELLATDVNPHACELARERGLSVVRADLVAPFAADAFDAVLFNPPYLPTPEGDTRGDWMEVALSGGESGRSVVAPFLADVGRVLAPGGVVLLLVSSLTGIDAVVSLAEEAGLEAETVAEESFPFERLVVIALCDN